MGEVAGQFAVSVSLGEKFSGLLPDSLYGSAPATNRSGGWADLLVGPEPWRAWPGASLLTVHAFQAAMVCLVRSAYSSIEVAANLVDSGESSSVRKKLGGGRAGHLRGEARR